MPLLPKTLADKNFQISVSDIGHWILIANFKNYILGYSPGHTFLDKGNVVRSTRKIWYLDLPKWSNLCHLKTRLKSGQRLKVRYCDSFCSSNSLIWNYRDAWVSFFGLSRWVFGHLHILWCLSLNPAVREMCVFLLVQHLSHFWGPVNLGNNNRPWKEGFGSELYGGGGDICCESGPGPFQEACVAPWAPWKRRTAGFHGIAFSVPTVVWGWLDGGIIRKMRLAGLWDHFQIHNPLFFQASMGQLSCISKK